MLFPFSSRSGPVRGSALLSSAGQRMAAVAVVVVLLWALTIWALQ